MTTEKYKNFYAELEMYEQSGVSMRLNNYPASPMRDYVWDEKGHVRELSFHNIKNS